MNLFVLIKNENFYKYCKILYKHSHIIFAKNKSNLSGTDYLIFIIILPLTNVNILKKQTKYYQKYHQPDTDL